MRRERLAAHVPRLLLEWRVRSPAERCRLIDASLVLADVSGFTSLSERLAARGKAGAEEITDVINTSFTRLLAVAYEDGAGLLKFGGDSLLLLLEGEDHPRRACRAAWRMQTELAEMGAPQTSVGPAELGMSIGVVSGGIHLFLVGDVHDELVVAGPEATRVVELESAARSGDILVSEGTAALLGPRTVRDGDNGILLVAPPRVADHAAEFPPPPGGVDPAAFVPEPLRDHLAAGDLEGEHRMATTAFIKFTSIDSLIEREGAAVAAAAVARLVERVEREAAGADVLVRGCDVDRDGGKLFLVAGAPTASEFDEEKMLRLVRRVVDDEDTLPVRAGINRGRVFTGEIGTPVRRTYAIMGDAVNVAARLMGKAETRQIVATPAVLERSLSLFESRRLAPLALKGKSQPVAAVSIGRSLGPKPRPGRRRLPLVGREREMAMLTAALESARAGRGRVVELVGEAGLGKSRLVEELCVGLADVGIQTIACGPFQADTPYAAFRDVLRSLLQVDARAAPAANTAQITERLALMAPDLVPWIPLLALVLDVETLPTPEVDHLAPDFRRAKLASLVATLVARLLPEANFVAFEDTHWMDEASMELLRAIAREAAGHPWLIIVTHRPGAAGALGDDAAAQVIEILPLSSESAGRLAGAAAGRTAIHPELMSALCERAGGNPLFLSELVRAATQQGSGEVPETVEAVVTTRIDRLPPRQRTLLRYASVLGATFSIQVLERCLPEGQSIEPDDWERVDEFIAPDAGGYRFAHALFRDVAYDSLSFQRRREIHGRAGVAYEELAGDRPDEIAELLSLHFSRAAEHARAWRYSRVAGDRARAKAANLEAAEFYSRALASAANLRGLDALDVAPTWEALGDVAETAGDFDRAADAYRRAMRLDRRRETAPRMLRKAGTVRERRGAYAAALRWYDFAARFAARVDGEERLRHQMEINIARAGVSYRLGDFKAMLAWCEPALADAGALQDAGGMGHAYYLIHLALLSLGSPERARYRGLAIPLLEEAGDERKLGNALSNLGADHYHGGDWYASLEHSRRGLEARMRAGDVVGVGVSSGNIAEIRSDQGYLDEAARLFEQARSTGAATGHHPLHAFATAGLGRIESRRDRHREARALLREAMREFADIGARNYVDSTEAWLAELSLLTGHPAAARRRADAILRRLDAEQLPGLIELLHRVRGTASLHLGDVAAARADLLEAISLARASSARFELALSLDALATLEDISGNGSAESLRLESSQLAASLGIVNLPQLPLPARAQARVAAAG